jgi:hypothetical protein
MSKLRTNIAEAIYKIVIDDLSRSPLKGSPMESIAILESLDYCTKTYTEFLFENKLNIKFLIYRLIQ